jgi:hypothetical protein
LKKFILFLGLMTSSSISHAWTVTADFEYGSIGEIATGSDGLTNNAAQATYTNEHVFLGGQALKAQVNSGGTAFGGMIQYPSSLGEGDEVWYRARWFFPSSWIFTTTSGQKLMRIGSKLNGGDWWDIYIDKDTQQIEPHTDLGASKVAFNDYKYGDSPMITGPRGQHGRAVKIDSWNTYEIYIKFSSIPSNSIIRIWQEGSLVFEAAGIVATLGSSNNVSDRVLIGNYYNGNAPKTMSAYIDNIEITSDRPSNSDANGNPMISERTLTPRPPVQLSVQ